jgi:hypothetical protein
MQPNFIMQYGCVQHNIVHIEMEYNTMCIPLQ